MKQGNVIVEQVLEDGTIINGYDESLSPAEIFQKLSDAFPNIYKDEERKLILGDHKGKKFAIRCKNITYLGIPHPAYKKRIQISNDLNDFVQEAQKVNAKPLLMGIYSNNDNLLFASFGIETYINKKANNSSAHVFTSDLAAASTEKYFEKTDFFKNSITVFTKDYVNAFLDRALDIEKDDFEYDLSILKQKYVDAHKIYIDEDEIAHYEKCFNNEIIPRVEDFLINQERDWKGINCYQEMIKDDYNDKYQSEWPAHYLEYKFNNYIEKNGIKDYIRFAQDKTKGGIDLDLFFPEINTYGDLKAHSEGVRSIPGNDFSVITKQILNEDKPGRVYYIVCEHSTEKDCNHGYEVTKFWNTAQKKTNLMSYSTRMKNSVRLNKLYILEININNMEYLSIFWQGINSNKKPRPPKIGIECKNFKHFVIHEMTL